MAAVLTGIIPKQGFELCRDAIGAIILVELTAQKQLQGVDFPEDVIVLLESLPPSDSSDYITMNVMTEGAKYNPMTQSEAQGNTTFIVDFYASGNSSTDSAFRLQKFIGMVGYIFRSAQYRTLGFPLGFIGGTYVESFVIGEAITAKKEDSSYSSYGQLKIMVRIQETAQQYTGIPFNENLSSVKLELTDKGYQYLFNN